MKGKVLFIYAKKMFKAISRRQVIFTDEHLAKMIDKFKMFENGQLEDKINEIGFAKIASIQDIAKNSYVLTPGRYVGIKVDEDETPFEDKMKVYSEEMSKLLKDEEELTKKVKEVFKGFNL